MVISIGQILAQWEAIGVFDFLLPFLFIFAVVFGILSSTNIIGGKKGVHIVVAFVIAALALRSGYVQSFFAQIVPDLGIALIAIVSLVILIGLFVHKKEARYWAWGISAVAFVIWLFIVLGDTWGGGVWIWAESYASFIIGAIILVGLIIAISVSTRPKTPKPNFGEFVRQMWSPQPEGAE